LSSMAKVQLHGAKYQRAFATGQALSTSRRKP